MKLYNFSHIKGFGVADFKSEVEIQIRLPVFPQNRKYFSVIFKFHNFGPIFRSYKDSGSLSSNLKSDFKSDFRFPRKPEVGLGIRVS